jgi:hypothetical protein
MLKLKLIASAVVVLGAVACEPLPVYAPNNEQRPYPPPSRDSRYFGYQREDRQNPSNNPRDDRNSGYYDAGPDRQPDERPATRDEYPSAEKTANPNQVLSPYAPYNVIDVEGFRSGQLAKDPSNGKIFRVP